MAISRISWETPLHSNCALSRLLCPPVDQATDRSEECKMFIVFMALTIAMVMVDGKVVLPGVRGVEAGCSRGEVKILVHVACSYN